MKEFKREYPLFSLCGLNCGLCPRYHTQGESKCPGCGGKDFNLKHPTCPVVTCNEKHDKKEYCFQCSSYPCKKYSRQSPADSFITYRNVLTDFEKARTEGLEVYKKELNQKIDYLEFLLANFNDGRRKNLYCLAVNLLNIDQLSDIINEINDRISIQDSDIKEKIAQIVLLLESKAHEANIELKLRK